MVGRGILLEAISGNDIDHLRIPCQRDHEACNAIPAAWKSVCYHTNLQGKLRAKISSYSCRLAVLVGGDKGCACEEHAPQEEPHNNRCRDRLQAPWPPALSALRLHENERIYLRPKVTRYTKAHQNCSC